MKWQMKKLSNKEVRKVLEDAFLDLCGIAFQGENQDILDDEMTRFEINLFHRIAEKSPDKV